MNGVTDKERQKEVEFACIQAVAQATGCDWSASANNDRALAISALDRAVRARRPRAGLLHHSDRGSVYASTDYGDAMIQLGARKSMSRKGDCWDKAVAESFFATIKGELLDHVRRQRHRCDRRLHRRLLQSTSSPLGSRLGEPD